MCGNFETAIEEGEEFQGSQDIVVKRNLTNTILSI
jgi:hypothetical protein